MIDPKFWLNKRVLITGHSGFKGSWLSFWLHELGAKVCGIAMPPSSSPNLFMAIGIEEKVENHFCDIRDRSKLDAIIKSFDPEIVVHMAAQPLVRESYRNPLETYEVNVIGTGNVLWSLKECLSVKSIVVVTTDKCYENQESDIAYKESDSLGGHDPYSSSKACAEILTASFRKSFFAPEVLGRSVGVATARAGNAIGGGDWSHDRIIPDAVRNIENNHPLEIRNPEAIRPWQHVLVPLSGYLSLAEKLWQNPEKFSQAFNFAPRETDCVSVRTLLAGLEKYREAKIDWTTDEKKKVHEAHFLKLDASKAARLLNWHPAWNLDQALKATADWYSAFYQASPELLRITREQINEVSRS